MIIIEAGIKDLTLKILPQPNAENNFRELRAGKTCPVTEECEELILEPIDRGCFCTGIYQPDFCICTSAIHPNNEQGCACDENEDATFNLDDCIETKTCTVNNTPIGCSCADNGPIQTGECKCSQLHHQDGCTLVKCFDKYQDFPCLCTQEPLKDTYECICPSNDLASLPCVYSTTLESNPQDCTIQDCLANSDTTVTKYSCYCTKDNHPTKCRCPSLPEDLQGIPVEQCQCLVDNDPRECGACPITRLCQNQDILSTPCLCTEDFHYENCICTPIYHPSTCECDTTPNPSFKIKTYDEVLRYEKLSTCDEETGYEGGDCKCADGQAPFDCTCSQNNDDDSYTKTECEDEKYEVLLNSSSDDSSPIYPQSYICIDGNSPEGCVCPYDSKDLIGVPVAQCECCSTGDPRSGLTTPGAGCPEYCIDNIYNGGCACDSDLTDYTECEADKAYPFLIDCNDVHGSSVKLNTCKCIDGYTPTGCTCPLETDLNQFDGVLPGQCECLVEDDPRVGISCPISRKCSNEDLQSPPLLKFNRLQLIWIQIYPTLLNYIEKHGSFVSPDTYKCSEVNSPLGFNNYLKFGFSYELDFALSCLRSVKLESNEQSTIISLLKEYINSYTFIDTSLNTPGNPIGYGKHAINLFSDLDEINKTIYTNTFDLQKDLMVLLNNPKDPHTIFTPHCVSKVLYMLPQITLKQYETDKQLYTTIQINDTDYIVDKINIKGKPIYDQDDNKVISYINKGKDLDILVIKSFNPKNQVNKLLIDLRGNGGGQVRLGRQLLNFLFPNVGHPLYQTVDETKSIINEALAKITIYQSDIYPKEAQLPLELDYMGIDKLFYSRGNRKRTTQSEDKKSIKTVNLTYKYMNYMGNNDTFAEYLKNKNIKRQILYQPQDVLIVTDGACASMCSQFVKHIGEKHLGRIVGIGAPYPIDKDIRFDVGMATSGSVYNYKSVQEIKSNEIYDDYEINKYKLSNKFYRIGSDLSWSNKGGYGFTDETSDQLLEYQIVDADFRVEYFPFDSLISDKDEQRFALYDEVLKREKQLLEPSDPKKCLSWEVETSNTQTPSNCKGCLRNDPYSIYGHPCSVRGSTEAKGRYSNGTAKIGEYLIDKCIFSHCKVGYYRKNIVIGQKIEQKCSLVPLGPNQNRSEITPDQTEDTEIVSNQCDMLVIVDEQVEQEEGEEEQQQSDQDKQKEIETEEPKSKAEMISGIVVAGVIVVASIVAMIIVAVVIQHQKYSGLGRRGTSWFIISWLFSLGLLFIRPPSDSDVNSLNLERRIDAFEGDVAPLIPFYNPDIQIKIKVEKYLSKAGVRIADGQSVISAHADLNEIIIGPDDEEYGIDTLTQIRLPKQKKKSWRRKFAKKKKKVIVDEDANKDQNEDDNKENLGPDGEKEDETDALINKMMEAENKDDKKEGEGEENKEEEDKYEYEEELKEKVNFDSEYGNDIFQDFDEDGQDEPDQQTGKEGAETEKEENELLIKICIQKKKQSCS
ncbi:MAG: hypothetical protein EZS28_007898 [Streblomastix strix]|uniref:Uncharacterized protein n=1 Tax=Streblomastix strix TaxID=222440 RepID=A0A5J4WQA4_9EUKA|nr:MAG: hypothetical protein EZS28_007898 [Streblomastix strix]